MKKLNVLLLATAVAMSFSSCNHEEEWNDHAGEIQLNMLYPGQESRATETSFEKSDSIGVYVTAAEAALQLGGNEVNNELFMYNGTSWTSKRTVYWNDGKHDVYAYYPYSSDVNEIENFRFDVLEDQSNAHNYTRSDFMWASATDIAASKNPVSMQFSHKMSNVIVNLETSENFDGDIPSTAEVYLYSTVTSALVDLSTGDVAKDSYAGEGTIKCRKLNNTMFTAIVVPQSITSRRPLVEVVVDNVSYLMEGKISYRQGYRHTITVVLDKNPDQIKIDIGGKVEGWN